MYREDKHEKHDQQDSTDPRVQARRALQAAYDWRDDERHGEQQSRTPAPSASWTAAV